MITKRGVLDAALFIIQLGPSPGAQFLCRCVQRHMERLIWGSIRRGNPRRGFPLGPPPALFGAQGSSALCGARPEALPLDSTTFEKVDETFIRARCAQRRAQRRLRPFRRRMRRIRVQYILQAGSGAAPVQELSARSSQNSPASSHSLSSSNASWQCPRSR